MLSNKRSHHKEKPQLPHLGKARVKQQRPSATKMKFVVVVVVVF